MENCKLANYVEMIAIRDRETYSRTDAMWAELNFTFGSVPVFMGLPFHLLLLLP
jgi:hypothetical protein